LKAVLQKIISFFRDWDNQSRYLGWMIKRTRPFAGSLFLLFVLNVVIAVTGVGGTVVSKYIIDGATGSGPNITTSGIIVLILITAVSIAVGAFSSIISTHINEKYAFGIRSQVFDNILNGTWMKVSSFHSGDMLTRLTSDIDRVANGIASILPNFLFLIIRILIAFGVLFYYDRFLAVMALVVGPVGVILSLIFSGKLHKYQTQLNATESSYRSFMQEAVEHIAVTKAFSRETVSHDRLLDFRDDRLRLILRRNKLSTAMNLCISVVFSAGYLIAFGWGIYRLSTGSITYGTMTVFLSLVAQVQGPIMGLGSIIPQFITVLSSTGRVMEIDSIVEEERLAETTPFPKAIGIRIQGLSFAYADEKVLDNLNIDIQPGETVGIVGYSGSGKTTLIRLILSLVSAQEGKLMFTGDNWEEEVSASARRFISYVPQGNTLFSGTIADNLRMGQPDADDLSVWKALEVADADDFVRALDEGINTRIGENGLGLSEGQAQRIAIARAVIRNAPILILDEATSALDASTEEKVLQRMCAAGLLKTCILITHRRTMLRFCVRALEIENKQTTELSIAE
jgi:ABC-type multidrug transport system fused ATPase/permease subunit